MGKNTKKPKQENKTINDKDKELSKPTVEPNEKKEEAVEEPKTITQKFVSKFDRFGDLFFLNVFFFVTSIPVITLGASLTALYTVTNKMIKNEEGPIKNTYMKAFKENFKQATAIWIFDLLCIAFVAGQYVLYLSNTETMFSKVLFIFMGFEFIVMAFAMPLQFPLLARYDNTTSRTILNSLILALTNLGVWFRIFFIWMFPIALYSVKPNLFFYSWFLWAMILYAVLAYACSMFLVKFYEKMESAEASK